MPSRSISGSTYLQDNKDDIVQYMRKYHLFLFPESPISRIIRMNLNPNLDNHFQTNYKVLTFTPPYLYGT